MPASALFNSDRDSINTDTVLAPFSKEIWIVREDPTHSHLVPDASESCIGFVQGTNGYLKSYFAKIVLTPAK